MPFNQFTRPIYLKNTRIDCGYGNLANKIMKRHAEKVHKQEKLQITFVITIFIQCHNQGQTTYSDYQYNDRYDQKFCLDFSTPKISQEDISIRLSVGNIKS